jgi:hypothetical protein
MAFFADISKIQQLFETYGKDLYALCFFYTGGHQQAVTLLESILSDLTCREKAYHLASSGNTGFFQVAYHGCQDYFLQKARRMPKADDLLTQHAPFPISRDLVALLRLPMTKKGPVFFTFFHRFSTENGASLLKLTPEAMEKKVKKVLAGCSLTEEQAKKAVESMEIGEHALLRIWEHWEGSTLEENFARKTRMRRVKRNLDSAAPLTALCILLFCGFCYLGVHFGWFTGTPFADLSGYRQELTPDPANDPVKEIEDYWNHTSTPSEDSLPLEEGTVSVYVPTATGFTLYEVKNTPLSTENLGSQMVMLGGMPVGSQILYVQLTDNGTESTEGSGESSVVTYTLGDKVSLTIEVNQEAAAYFENSDNLPMLQAMTASFAAFHDLTETDSISLQYNGEEISCAGKTAADFLGETITPEKTVETNYRSTETE